MSRNRFLIARIAPNHKNGPGCEENEEIRHTGGKPHLGVSELCRMQTQSLQPMRGKWFQVFGDDAPTPLETRNGLMGHKNSDFWRRWKIVYLPKTKKWGFNYFLIFDSVRFPDRPCTALERQRF